MAVAAPAAAQSSDVTGVWTADFVTSERTYPARIEFKQDGSTVTGAVGPANGETNKLTGTVKEGKLTFAFSTPDPNGGGGILAIEVTASVAAEGLSGSFTVDGDPTGTFSAKRGAAKPAETPKTDAPAAAPAAVGGTWSFTVDLGSITASPTVAFKQEGETLTGTYTSQQYGQFPLKGTIKGNDLAFSFTMTIEGNALDVHFTGKVDKDAASGSVNYGGIGDGTFTAKKQQ
jgi:hypothetical protein